MSTHHTVLWISVLLSAIAAAVIGTIIDNVVKGGAERNHNTVLLINECFAEHYIAYLIFFTAMATGTSFSKYWGTPVLQIAIIAVLGIYVKAIHSTTRHKAKILNDHPCTDECKERLKVRTVLRMSSTNIVLTAVMFLLSCYLAFITVHDPSGQ